MAMAIAFFLCMRRCRVLNLQVAQFQSGQRPPPPSLAFIAPQDWRMLAGRHICVGFRVLWWLVARIKEHARKLAIVLTSAKT